MQSDAKRQARDQELHSLGVADAPSFTGAHSTDDHSTNSHNRRPSNALSFASTIPDGVTDEALIGGRTTRAATAAQATANADEDVEEEPKKFLGIFKRKKKAVAIARVRPDPSPTEMAPFAIDLTPSSMYHLIDPKSYEHLGQLGGTPGILSGLKTDAKMGLSDEGGEIPLSERVRVYGANRTPARKGKSLLRLMWMAYQDKVLVRAFWGVLNLPVVLTPLPPSSSCPSRPSSRSRSACTRTSAPRRPSSSRPSAPTRSRSRTCVPSPRSTGSRESPSPCARHPCAFLQSSN